MFSNTIVGDLPNDQQTIKPSLQENLNEEYVLVVGNASMIADPEVWMSNAGCVSC